MNKSCKQSGFTLIEMLIAVFVFMILFLIAASFVNLAAGSTKSNRTKLMTNDIRSALDVISQKLSTANGISTSGIYGFAVNSTTGDLGIVSDDGTNIICTFIGKVSVGTPAIGGIYMRTGTDCSWPSGTKILSISDQPLTNNKNINITTNPTGTTKIFTLTDAITSSNKTTYNKSPYLKVLIEAKDTDPKYESDNVIKLQTMYTMDYKTIMRLKSL